MGKSYGKYVGVTEAQLAQRQRAFKIRCLLGIAQRAKSIDHNFYEKIKPFIDEQLTNLKTKTLDQRRQDALSSLNQENNLL